MCVYHSRRANDNRNNMTHNGTEFTLFHTVDAVYFCDTHFVCSQSRAAKTNKTGKNNRIKAHTMCTRALFTTFEQHSCSSFFGVNIMVWALPYSLRILLMVLFTLRFGFIGFHCVQYEQFIRINRLTFKVSCCRCTQNSN